MKNRFLNKLKEEGKLELVEPSENICNSYTTKSSDCLKSAKLLLQNNLFENSISMSYYAMYNILLALLFRTGIKCENHSGSIILLRTIFERADLYNLIANAKKERIDKQYYISTEKDAITKEIADELLNQAEDFVLETRVIIKKLGEDSINKFREALRAV
ncbi:MAG TPA: HEPN domain-containing protein [Candidatus Woesearchaeota archaeon]|nr:MAG: DNA-binding protein [Candidatus Woesearchaeota archaeon]HDD70907.1 HEPN domain-containing protein [Candidatus Woesearchaeota archaeon]